MQTSQMADDDAKTTAGNYTMKWSEGHDLVLSREVLVLEPWKFPKQSKERGDIWGEVASHLNGSSFPKFKVSKRSVRDRLTLLVSKYKEKMRKEEQASGIECEETELDMALSEIIDKDLAADLERKENSNTLTKKNVSDKASAEESRIKAMERLGETKKRKADGSYDLVTPPKRGKLSTTEAVQVLKEKFEYEKGIRKEEMEMKKKEQEKKDGAQQMMMEQMQNFQMMFLQQQQQQSQLLMGLLDRVLPKSS